MRSTIGEPVVKLPEPLGMPTALDELKDAPTVLTIRNMVIPATPWAYYLGPRRWCKGLDSVRPAAASPRCATQGYRRPGLQVLQATDLA